MLTFLRFFLMKASLRSECGSSGHMPGCLDMYSTDADLFKTKLDLQSIEGFRFRVRTEKVCVVMWCLIGRDANYTFNIVYLQFIEI